MSKVKLNGNAAVSLIKAGLESGAIKLNAGSGYNTESGAEEVAKADAKYLITLLTELTGNQLITDSE